MMSRTESSKNTSIKELLGEKEYLLRKERGERAIALRKALGNKPRGYFKVKYHLPDSTLQSWENVNYGGMTENGAKQLVEIYNAEGIPVTVEWLMFGIGSDPLDTLKIGEHFFKRIGKNLGLASKENTVYEEDTVNQEVKMFCQLNKNAIHVIITDEALAPWLTPGDHVAGKWHYDQDIALTVGVPCIAQTIEGKTYTRIIKPGDEKGTYTLIAATTNSSNANLTIRHVKLFSVAPIIRIWKTKFSKLF